MEPSKAAQKGQIRSPFWTLKGNFKHNFQFPATRTLVPLGPLEARTIHEDKCVIKESLKHGCMQVPRENYNIDA